MSLLMQCLDLLPVGFFDLVCFFPHDFWSLFGQASYSCLLSIKSHTLCMKKYKDNLKCGMILSSFREDLVLLLMGSKARGR